MNFKARVQKCLNDLCSGPGPMENIKLAGIQNKYDKGMSRCATCPVAQWFYLHLSDCAVNNLKVNKFKIDWHDSSYNFVSVPNIVQQAIQNYDMEIGCWKE